MGLGGENICKCQIDVPKLSFYTGEPFRATVSVDNTQVPKRVKSIRSELRLFVKILKESGRTFQSHEASIIS